MVYNHTDLGDNQIKSTTKQPLLILVVNQSEYYSYCQKGLKGFPLVNCLVDSLRTSLFLAFLSSQEPSCDSVISSGWVKIMRFTSILRYQAQLNFSLNELHMSDDMISDLRYHTPVHVAPCEALQPWVTTAMNLIWLETPSKSSKNNKRSLNMGKLSQGHRINFCTCETCSLFYDCRQRSVWWWDVHRVFIQRQRTVFQPLGSLHCGRRHGRPHHLLSNCSRKTQMGQGSGNPKLFTQGKQQILRIEAVYVGSAVYVGYPNKILCADGWICWYCREGTLQKPGWPIKMRIC